MKELFVVRHGHADHIERGLTGGWTNSQLTQLGRQQALLTGQRLQSFLNEKSFRFYSSDLDRAKETAEIIGEILQSDLITTTALRELNWGIAVNMSLEEASKLELEKTEPLIDWIPFPEAESRRMLYHRIDAFLTQVKDEIDVGIIVSHGNAIECIILWWLQLPESFHSNISFDIDPCSISWLRINDWNEKTLSLLNSTDHLFPLKSSI